MANELCVRAIKTTRHAHILANIEPSIEPIPHEPHRTVQCHCLGHFASFIVSATSSITCIKQNVLP